MARDDGPLLVGLDCGTSRIKAGAYARDGRCLGFGAEAVPVRSDGPDRATHDPDELWTAAAGAIRAALAGLDADRVAGVACASVGEAALLVDRAGAPLTPIFAWFDRRGAETCRSWIEAEGAGRLYARTGQPPEPILSAYKLDWLRRHEAAACRAAAAFVSLADYMAFRLSGVMAAEPSLAVRSGVLDIATGRFADDLIAARGLDPGLFLPLQPSGTPLGPVRPQAAAETGLPRTALVSIGGYDQALGALVCGGFEPGTLAVTLGSTEAQVLPAGRAVPSPALGAAGVCQCLLAVEGTTRRFLLKGIYTAGSALEWLRTDLFGGVTAETLIAEAAAVPPGSHGVGFLPHLLIGDAPGARLRPNGAFWGLGLGTGRATLYRAALEALAYEGRLCTEAMIAAPDSGPVERIRAVGGETSNPLRLAIKAAVSAAPVEIVAARNASGLGAALMAGLGAGVHRSLAEARAALRLDGAVVLPDPALVAFYRPALAAYRRAAPLVAALGAPR
ncbi:FGGY-family carbohydrate kinase [Prosthecomicrobium pneumaticum]|uniref:Xylulokinase n=1 Tax=Prosthecomicrobium pneumaticum TaxID=81895 RepID=A0A7W9L202_9HYPH|nr:FGGY family carbohydrate kinase [Prosthecomicrobium pneumaticum]MBB5753129.1 xylulokinase [Prosthecomicrobium pneumaticum]